VLEVTDIHTYYGKSYVIKGVSLEVRKGSVISILGRNGMGKTTIIRSIIGFTPPRRGQVSFKGKDITHLQTYQISQMGLALVPQGRLIFPSLTVKENLMLGERHTGQSEEWSLQKVCALFPILKERANLKGNLLSGGEQQMLCIGRALITNPDLILMDEPSEGLSPLIIKEIGRIIKQLQTNGLSILLVEQSLTLALKVAEYVYLVDKGIIVHHGTPEELRRSQEVMTKYLGASV
jgi:branched-chain amino acid transport system ATP-binding protein